jgi:hypothetical protein
VIDLPAGFPAESVTMAESFGLYLKAALACAVNACFNANSFAYGEYCEKHLRSVILH